MPKRVSSVEAHIRGLAPQLHISKETSQRWRVVANTVSDLTGPTIELQTPRTDSNTSQQPGGLNNVSIFQHKLVRIQILKI